ncbi:hypothetical protein BDZ97DRAFT_119394 [Flammula alnicola]|nr:hypothetical protein BDZ97DRAFT_119394 [Flammula alnicola]
MFHITPADQEATKKSFSVFPTYQYPCMPHLGPILLPVCRRRCLYLNFFFAFSFFLSFAILGLMQLSYYNYYYSHSLHHSIFNFPPSFTPPSCVIRIRFLTISLSSFSSCRILFCSTIIPLIARRRLHLWSSFLLLYTRALLIALLCPSPSPSSSTASVLTTPTTLLYA